MSLVKSLALALLVAVLALTASGCGGGGEETSSAEEWIDAFCTAGLEWRTELERIGEEVRDVSSLSVDRIEELAEEGDAATDDFVDEVQDLGRPETASGEQIELAIDDLANTFDRESAEIEGAVDEIDGIAEAATAGGTVTASVGEMMVALGDTLETLGSSDADEELRAAFEESEVCDELRA